MGVPVPPWYQLDGWDDVHNQKNIFIGLVIQHLMGNVSLYQALSSHTDFRFRRSGRHPVVIVVINLDSGLSYARQVRSSDVLGF